jgi:hypothetical protein
MACKPLPRLLLHTSEIPQRELRSKRRVPLHNYLFLLGCGEYQSDQPSLSLLSVTCSDASTKKIRPSPFEEGRMIEQNA